MAQTNSYRYLNRAQLSINYLHSNSTTHEFLFGALAEMIDNSRDANAKNINIYAEKNDLLRGGYMLCFLDDGCGMNPGEAHDIMTFGRSFKKDDIIGNDRKMIGQYGNGLKSGSMRIGNDFILLTKCHNHPMTCLLLSRTFHEEEKIDEVIVPSPSFYPDSRKLFYEDEDMKEKAETELAIIFKYSPFKDWKLLMKAFDSITSPSGTLVCVYSLKLNSDGHSELDFETDPNDILIKPPSITGLTAIADDGIELFALGPPSSSLTRANLVKEEICDTPLNGKSVRALVKEIAEKSNEPMEKISFRAYLSILYFQSPSTAISIFSTTAVSSNAQLPDSKTPTTAAAARDHFNMWLRQGRIIRTHWLQWLFKPKRYTFTCNKFKACAETDYRKTEKEAKIAEEVAREAESKARDLRNRYGHVPMEKHKRMELRKSHDQAKSLRQKADILKVTAERKAKGLKDAKSLDLIFGINLYDRSKCGAFVYNQSRLTKMYQPFNNNSVSSLKNNGVVCLIDIPYEILEPTHNKQDFADDKEWKMLKGVINNHYNDYVADIIASVGSTEYSNWKEFWSYFGYLNSTDLRPSNETKYLTRRAMVIPKYKQCARCSKYRRIPFQMSVVASGERENPFNPECYDNLISPDSQEIWECSQNLDKKTNRCEVLEQKIDIPLVKLRGKECYPVIDITTTHSRSRDSNGSNSHHHGGSGKSSKYGDGSDTSEDEDQEEPSKNNQKSQQILYQQPQIFRHKSSQNHGADKNTDPDYNPLSENSPKTSQLFDNGVEQSDKDSTTIASLRRPANLQPNAAALNSSPNSADSLKGAFFGSDLNSITDSLFKSASNDDSEIVADDMSPSKKSKSTSSSKVIKRKHKEDPTFTVNSKIKANAISGLNLRRSDEKLEIVVKQFGTILKYFTPPNYIFSPDEAETFDADQIKNLDLLHLKGHYEKELERFISKKATMSSNVQVDINENKEYQRLKATLLQLRRNVSSMLKIMHPEINLLPNTESEEVDAFVHTSLTSHSLDD